jgi:small subunit ribosomal protein S11
LSVKTTDNNTMIVLTDKEWNKVLWWGTWLLWYKWAKKNTPYAAEMLTKSILKDAQGLWLKDVWIIFRWAGMARDGVFKAINEIWMIDIMYIKEETPIQFGWCKGKRPKRN